MCHQGRRAPATQPVGVWCHRGFSLCRRCSGGHGKRGRRALVRRALFSPARKTPCSPKHLRALCTPGTHPGIRKGDERTRDVRLTELPCLNRF